MSPEFSEFSYGFAFTFDFINRNPCLRAAPTFPSLNAEGKVGWDLKLPYQGHPKFFQFKLSEYMRGQRAIHWSTYGQPHYRFRITPRGQSNQHNLLSVLSAEEKEVYYVAPTFHEQGRFDDLFRQGVVTDNSIWIPVSCLPMVEDSNQHYVTFDVNGQKPHWDLEPLKCHGFSAEERGQNIDQRRTIGEGFYRGLRDTLLTAIREIEPDALNQRVQSDDIAAVIRETHGLLASQFGLQMVILADAN